MCIFSQISIITCTPTYISTGVVGSCGVGQCGEGTLVVIGRITTDRQICRHEFPDTYGGVFVHPQKTRLKWGGIWGEWAGCGGLTIIGLSDYGASGAYVCVCANLIGPINAIRGIIN